MICEPGRSLKWLLEQSEGDVLLVSPFIKQDAFQRAVEFLEEDAQVKVLTRWLLDEITTGVSDIEIFQIARTRGNCEIYLRSDLHAKYYRRGSRCLVGSANLTYAGMGWGVRNNVEILVAPEMEKFSVLDVENQLFSDALKVDHGLYQRYRDLIDSLPGSELVAPALGSDVGGGALSENWLPALRNPEYLFWAYSGQVDLLHTFARQLALAELEVLKPPSGLSERAFQSWIGLCLIQTRAVRLLDSHLAEPRRFGYMRKLLGDQFPDREASEAWQTMMRWLLYFFPERYRMFTTNYSEVFRRTHA